MRQHARMDAESTTTPAPGAASATSAPWGRTRRGEPVERWELRLPSGAGASVLTRGAALASLRVPDAAGHLDDVVVGLADVGAYEEASGYPGAVVGRVANRIAGGRFVLDGTEHRVPVNDGAQALHGGAEGFDQRVWSARAVDVPGGAGVRLELVSPDGDMGFPGRLEAAVVYALTEEDGAVVLALEYEARADAPTPVSLTNHAYLNLDGAGSGSVEDHVLQLRAARYLPVDAGLVPAGGPADVAGTPFDFREPVRVGERLREADEQLRRAGGYDHDWVLDEPAPGRPGTAAVLRAGRSGRVLTVTTDRPGVQFYSGNFLTGAWRTADGRAVRQGDALCLETQAHPDAVNQPELGNVVLRPGAVWRSTTALRFTAG